MTVADRKHKILNAESLKIPKSAEIAKKVFIRCQKSLSSIPFVIPGEKF